MPRWTSVQRLASSGKEERITGNEWAIPIALLCKSEDDVRRRLPRRYAPRNDAGVTPVLQLNFDNI